MTTEPAIYNLTIYQGANFSQQFTWTDTNNTPINLTGYTARMHARTSVNAPTPFLNLTSPSGGITLGGSAGTVTVALTAAATAAIDEVLGVYDLELVAPSGDVTRFLQGTVTISREVTR